MKTDYNPEIRNFITENYDPVASPAEASEYTEMKSLENIFKEVINILPEDWVYRADVYEILNELGFKAFPYLIPEERDEETDEILIKSRRMILYYLDRKTATI